MHEPSPTTKASSYTVVEFVDQKQELRWWCIWKGERRNVTAIIC